MKISNIVVGTDLSENCAAAARWAEAVKARTGARVFVEHVIEISVSSWLNSAYEVLEKQELREEAERKVQNWYREATGEAPDAVELRAGSCLQQLTDYVEQLEGETLLVVAMSGKTALKRFFVGSTAQTVAGRPPAPVVVVHPEHPGVRPESPIVVGTDFSANADRAITYAASLAKILGNRLVIIHGNAAPQMSVFESTDVADELLETNIAAVAEEKLEETLGLNSVLGDLDYDTEIIQKDPADAIVQYAEEHDVDLIVMGHSGESPVVRNVLGSVSQKVLRSLPCSLCITPAVESDE